MSDNIKNKFGIQRKRSYLNRDFDDFRLDLLRYANIYFKDKIQDFSEDNIVNTVNYEEVVDLVIKIVEHESFDLIESLSKNIVKQIITRYQKSNVIINEIRATVHKPNTILKSKTEDISVSYFEKLK